MPTLNKTAVGAVALTAGAAAVVNKRQNEDPLRGPWDANKDAHVNYDYIILGGGTAGCVLASRLAENPNVSILVLEAGYSDDIPGSMRPAFATSLWHTDKDWNLTTVPQVNCFGRVMNQPRGKLLGGSSSINAMMYHRGPASDFDEWELLGNPGWSYKECLHYFKKSEGLNDPRLPVGHPRGPLTKRVVKPKYEEFEAEYHNETGPWQITYHHMFGATEGFIRASVAEGVPFNKDFNGSSTMGVNRVQTFIQRDAIRSSAARAYLGKGQFLGENGKPRADRGRVRIVYGANIVRILVQMRRGVKVAVGAEFLDANREMHSVTAVKEVLLCAGAFGSPHILLASGIGPSPHKTIPHIHTLAGVGRNLQDHLGVPLNFYASTNSHSFSRKIHQIPGALFEYAVNGAGPISSQGSESAAFVRLEQIAPDFVAREKANGTWQDRSSGPNSPHLEILFVPSFIRHHSKTKAPDTQKYFTLIGLLLNPVSEGTVSISDEVKDGRLETLIDPNYFSDEFDTRVMAECVRFMRRIAARLHDDPEVGGKEMFPGTDVVPSDDDAKLQDYVKRESSVYYHPTSTCRMGPTSDPLAVVDARLNVYGIDRLRIVDASIAPKLPAAHTCAMSIMIAEKAADMIKEDWKEVPAKL
ncbi:hypothetical protein BGZ83_011213 [Gryganskiella cystojenkinii]|nr:hypothetical protein BGZ83_011213 [Gryganskiella cystojenkinii]